MYCYGFICITASVKALGNKDLYNQINYSLSFLINFTISSNNFYKKTFNLLVKLEHFQIKAVLFHNFVVYYRYMVLF